MIIEMEESEREKERESYREAFHWVWKMQSKVTHWRREKWIKVKSTGAFLHSLCVRLLFTREVDTIVHCARRREANNCPRSWRWMVTCCATAALLLTEETINLHFLPFASCVNRRSVCAERSERWKGVSHSASFVPHQLSDLEWSTRAKQATWALRERERESDARPHFVAIALMQLCSLSFSQFNLPFEWGHGWGRGLSFSLYYCLYNKPSSLIHFDSCLRVITIMVTVNWTDKRRERAWEKEREKQ